MATGTAGSTPDPSPHHAVAEPTRPRDRFIVESLDRIGLHVKLVELATLLITLLVFTMAYALVVVLVDHWIVDLGRIGRWVAWLGLPTLMLPWIAIRIAPLLRFKIHPLYAARAVERDSPELKNGLINFLWLRSHRTHVKPLVYDAIEQQAVQGMQAVNVESVVERTHLIQMGYWLAGLVVAFCLYQLVSPKDPLQTVARLAIPWAEIQRPARVEIKDVQPGNSTVYVGEQLEVSAIIKGLRDSEPVEISYSTADGQIADQIQTLIRADGDQRHRVTIPGPSGVQVDLIYRLFAGDTVSRDFHVRASTAPTIVVEQVDYAFPGYTAKANFSEQQGDIRAIEGTRVTVRARANLPMKSARLYFQRPGEESWTTLPTRFQSMTTDGQEAEFSFTLRLQEDRRTPKYTGYELRFVSDDNQPGVNPVRYRIDVLPDLPPLVEILTPERQRVEVAEDGQQLIEVRALDPDFGLTQLNLIAMRDGKRLLKKSLLDSFDDQDDASSSGQVARSGSVVARLVCIPRQWMLRAGDEMIFWADAADNRHSSWGELDPNLILTPRYQIVITAPRERTLPAAEEEERGDQDVELQRDEGEDSAAANQQPSADPSSNEAGNSDETGKGQTSSESSSDSGEQENADTPSSAEDVPSESGQGGSGDASDQENAQSEDSQGDDAGGRGKADGEDSGTSTTGSNEPGSEQGAGPQGSSREDSGKGNSGKGDSQQGKSDGGPADSEQADSNSAAGTHAKERTRGEASSDSEENPADFSSKQSKPTNDGSDDGEVIEEVLEYIGQDRRQPKSENRGTSAKDAQAEEDQTESTDRSGGEQDGDRPGKRGEKDEPTDQVEKGQGDLGDEKAKDANDGHSSKGETSQSDRVPPTDLPATDETAKAQPGNADGAKESGKTEGTAAGASDDRGDPDKSNQGVSKDADSPGSPAEDGDLAKISNQPDRAERSGEQTDQQASDLGRHDDQALDGEKDTAPLGGGPRHGQQPGESTDDPSIQADEPNLEYSRKATNMVLDYLRHHQDEPDPALLDRLGWTKGDLGKFLDRWRQFQQSDAGQETNDFDDAVRSLGLAPPESRVRRGPKRTDSLDGVRDAGQRSQPPAEFAELFEAFTKGTASVEENSVQEKK